MATHKLKKRESSEEKSDWLRTDKHKTNIKKTLLFAFIQASSCTNTTLGLPTETL